MNSDIENRLNASKSKDVPTMADVAQRAGVSVATVSRVVQGSHIVHSATRAKVLKAVEELNYIPNIGAQELARGETKVLGMIVNSIRNPVPAEIFQGVEDRLQKLGYRILLSNSYYDASLEERLVRTYISLSASGIIVDAPFGSEDFYQSLPSERIPIVLINPEAEHSTPSRIPTVSVDGILGGKLAGEHLIALGHRRIAYVGCKPVGCLQQARLEGLRRSLTQAGLEFIPDFFVVEGGPRGAEDSEAGYLGTKRLLEQKNPPTAYFCYHDLTAYGALQALKEAGMEVPKDASVIGFDDIFPSQYVGLTTLAQPWREMGRLAASVLLERLTRRVRLAELELRIAPDLLVRETTGPCSDINDR